MNQLYQQNPIKYFIFSIIIINYVVTLKLYKKKINFYKKFTSTPKVVHETTFEFGSIVGQLIPFAFFKLISTFVVNTSYFDCSGIIGWDKSVWNWKILPSWNTTSTNNYIQILYKIFIIIYKIYIYINKYFFNQKFQLYIIININIYSFCFKLNSSFSFIYLFSKNRNNYRSLSLVPIMSTFNYFILFLTILFIIVLY